MKTQSPVGVGWRRKQKLILSSVGLVALAAAPLHVYGQAAAYVMNTQSNTISIIDSSNNNVGNISAGTFPATGALSPDRSRLYVASAETNQVLVFETTYYNLVAAISVGPFPSVVALTPDGSHLYVSDSPENSPRLISGAPQGNVAVIDTSTFAVSYITQGLGTNPFGVAVTPDGSQVWVVSDSDGIVSLINTSTNTVTGSYPTSASASPQNVAFSPDGKTAFITNEGINSITVISTSNLVPDQFVNVGVQPIGLAVSPNGSRVLVADYGDNTVAVIDTTNGYAVSYLAAGTKPSWVDFSSDGTRAYVTNLGEGTVGIYDATNSFALLTKTAVGAMPYGVVARPPAIASTTNNTPAGTNISVQLNTTEGLVAVDFSAVSGAGGSTSATPIQPSTAGTLPGGYTLLNAAYAWDVSTTAPYSAPVMVCFTLAPPVDSTTFSNLRVLHNEGGTLVDRTVLSGPYAPNFSTNTICAQTSSLSPFVIAQVGASTTTMISAPSVTYGFSASVSVTVNSPSTTPTGTVSLSINGGTPTTQTLSGGYASFPLNNLGAGTYNLVANFTSQQGFSSSTSTASLVVTAAPLIVTANAVSAQYGSTAGPFSASFSGFVYSDSPASLSGVVACATAATNSSNVGNYAINCSGLSSTNYNIGYSPGVLTILQAPLTITAGNATKVLNAPNPTFTANESGFVLAQSVAVLGGTLSCASTALTTSPVGSYPITCSGLTSTNYRISYLPGTLKVLYASGGACDGAAGHLILPPIDASGFSVFNQGRTVPAQFRVCDANGASIGTAGVVTSFNLTAIVSGTITTTVSNVVDSSTPDTAFRFDTTAQEWIFNITTSPLAAGSTYIYMIGLNDGTNIAFQYGLR